MNLLGMLAFRLQVECQLSAARVRYDTYVTETEDKLQLMMQTVEKLELENSELRTRLDEEKRLSFILLGSHMLFLVYSACEMIVIYAEH